MFPGMGPPLALWATHDHYVSWGRGRLFGEGTALRWKERKSS